MTLEEDLQKGFEEFKAQLNNKINHNLLNEYLKHYNPDSDIERDFLRFLKKANLAGKFERTSLDYSNPIKRVNKDYSNISVINQTKDKEKSKNMINLLNRLGNNPNFKLKRGPIELPFSPRWNNLILAEEQINPELYYMLAEKIIEKLKLPYFRFSIDQTHAFMHTVDFLRSDILQNTDFENLLIGDMAEATVQKLFYEENIEFTARSILAHNSRRPQEVKDISSWIDNKKIDIGVKSHRSLKDYNTYYNHRIFTKEEQNKIADYVIFVNHFDYLIYYITGIVEKEFLLDGLYLDSQYQTTFPILESIAADINEFRNYYKVVNKRMEKEGKEISPEEFTEKLIEHYNKTLTFNELKTRLNKAF